MAQKALPLQVFGSAIFNIMAIHQKPVWNPDIVQPINFYDGWSKVPEQEVHDNAFKAQWELFLKHIVIDTPFPWNLMEGAKGVQLAEKGLESWAKRSWVDIPEL